jgi:hypothetical protein
LDGVPRSETPDAETAPEDDPDDWESETRSGDRPSLTPQISVTTTDPDAAVDALLADADDENERTSTVDANELIDDRPVVSRSLPPILAPPRPASLPPPLPRVDTGVSHSISQIARVIRQDLIDPVQATYGLQLRSDGLSAALATDARRVIISNEWLEQNAMADVTKLILCSIDVTQYEVTETHDLDQGTFETLFGVMLDELETHGHRKLNEVLRRICPHKMDPPRSSSRSTRQARKRA